MEHVTDVVEAEAKVLRDMREVVARVRELSGEDVKGVSDGIEKLRNIRSSVFENINQIQHEYLILRGLRWLTGKGLGSNFEWQWNPRQKGSGDEPDLRGMSEGKILVSAEASASEKPQGILDTRMRKTLEKLARMEGEKFYFVCTSAMESRARSKVSKGKWQIQVVRV